MKIQVQKALYQVVDSRLMVWCECSNLEEALRTADSFSDDKITGALGPFTVQCRERDV